MTPFNPEGKDAPTYGDCLRPAMEITEQADADQYMAAYVSHIQRHLDAQPREDDMTAEQIAKVNLGTLPATTTTKPVSAWNGCSALGTGIRLGERGIANR